MGGCTITVRSFVFVRLLAPHGRGEVLDPNLPISGPNGRALYGRQELADPLPGQT